MKYIGITAILAGLLGITGALDTGCGWCTSIALLFGGTVFILIHFLERRMDVEKEDGDIAAQFLVTFYKPDKLCSKGGRMKKVLHTDQSLAEPHKK